MRNRGFTIVELLIVIVVIGILAAITVVAFNGVTQNARISALQAELSQAGKSLDAFKVAESGSGQYPATLSEVNINTSGDVTYDYTPANDIVPASYCLEATSGGVTQHINATNKQPREGGCTITNFVTNPSFETNTSGYGYNFVGTTGTVGLASDGAIFGNSFMRRSITNTVSSRDVGPFISVTGLSESTSYSLVAYVRTSIPTQYRIAAERRNSSGTNIGTLHGTVTSVPANTWVKLSALVPPTPTMDRLTFTVYSSLTNWTPGTTIDVDGLLLTDRDYELNFYDGSTSGWVWNGTPNASTSTGPSF